MIDDSKNFDWGDTVSTVSSKTNLVKYGVITNVMDRFIQKQRKYFNVKWYPNGVTKKILADKLVLVDRFITPGEKVRRTNEIKTSQLGLCTAVGVSATVKVFNTNVIIEGIDHQKLIRLQPFRVNEKILYESFVGVVLSTQTKITLCTKDGSIFTYIDINMSKFTDCSKKELSTKDKSKNGFYRGQKFKMNLNYLKYATFITMSNIMRCFIKYMDKFKFLPKTIIVYVYNVSILAVNVKWINQVGSEESKPYDIMPDSVLRGDDLKKITTLDLFKMKGPKLGNMFGYTIDGTEHMMSKSQWFNNCTWSYNMNQLISKQEETLDANTNLDIYDFVSMNNLLAKYTKDLNKKQNFRLTQLQSSKMLSNRDVILSKSFHKAFKPNFKNTIKTGNLSIFSLKSNKMKRIRIWKHLVTKSKFETLKLVLNSTDSKVIVEIFNTKSMANVVWQDATEEKLFTTDIYQVIFLSKPEYFPGNYITHPEYKHNSYGIIQSVDYTEQTALVQWFKDNPKISLWPDLTEKIELSVYEFVRFSIYRLTKLGCFVFYVGDDINLKSSIIGQILKFKPDGTITVLWLNGKITQCWPLELKSINTIDNRIKAMKTMKKTRDKLYIKNVSSARSPQNDFESSMKMPDSSPASNERTEQAQSQLLKIDKGQKDHPIYKLLQLRGSFQNNRRNDGQNNFAATNINTVVEDSNAEKTLKQDEEKPRLCETFIEDKAKSLQRTMSDDNMHQFISSSQCTNGLNNKNDHQIDYHNVTLHKNTESKFEIIPKPEEIGVFSIIDILPADSHSFSSDCQTNMNLNILKVVSKDIKLLQTCLPAGIWVKSFENRLDYFSVIIKGPENTPYDCGLFRFDLQISSNYPATPPHCHYHNFCKKRINPNLHKDGKVCLSLLGTWIGKDSENWSPNNSTLLQVLVSIQGGLIFVNEPYYNEPGLSKDQRDSKEMSRLYNELVLIKVVESMTNLLICTEKSNGCFKEEILTYFKLNGSKLIASVKKWIEMSGRKLSEEEKLIPGYPLLPLSRGCCLTMKNVLKDYTKLLISMNIIDE